mmetsp:Transcript_4755/g.10573  ORF Transcript_4755/g.10573 Transcript_4755/m.10573 type:complete len:172 (+) Transcript_4755:513-1028(+)
MILTLTLEKWARSTPPNLATVATCAFLLTGATLSISNSKLAIWRRFPGLPASSGMASTNGPSHLPPPFPIMRQTTPSSSVPALLRPSRLGKAATPSSVAVTAVVSVWYPTDCASVSQPPPLCLLKENLIENSFAIASPRDLATTFKNTGPLLIPPSNRELFGCYHRLFLKY